MTGVFTSVYMFPPKGVAMYRDQKSVHAEIVSYSLFL